MPTSLTLKNVPDLVYERLKAAAQLHHRSINGEAIVCLETVLMPQPVTVSERLAQVREMRAGLTQETFRSEDIAQYKREGRK